MSYASSKKYVFDFDFDDQEDELLIHYDKNNQKYDYIEFYLSTQGFFKYKSESGYDYMPNDSGILIDNDGWEANRWDLFYLIKKEGEVSFFIFNEKSLEDNSLNKHFVFRITKESISQLFEKPFRISKVLPQGSKVNLFGNSQLHKAFSDTVINDRAYRMRAYVPYLCYSLDSIETYELNKSISYNIKFNLGWMKSKRRRVITDKLSKNELFLFETYRQFPETSLRFLSKSDLSIYSKEELRNMRNEIFADYGYAFDDDLLKWQYEKSGWYKEEDKDVRDDLSEIEIANINLIKEIEGSSY